MSWVGCTLSQACHVLLTQILPERPQIEETVDEDGIRTIVEYSVNDEGQKIKVSNLDNRARRLTSIPLCRSLAKLGECFKSH
jgi:hypothetical protein